MAVLLLIGTVTGNAERVAEDVAEFLGNQGVTLHLVDMADAYPELLLDYTVGLLCLSTWGEGELPDNAIDLYEGLTAYRPDLAHFSFGTIALGDHEYDPHFCAAAPQFAQILTELGATEITPPHEIDQGPPDEDIAAAQAWAGQCLAKMDGRA